MLPICSRCCPLQPGPRCIQKHPHPVNFARNLQLHLLYTLPAAHESFPTHAFACWNQCTCCCIMRGHPFEAVVVLHHRLRCLWCSMQQYTCPSQAVTLLNEQRTVRVVGGCAPCYTCTSITTHLVCECASHQAFQAQQQVIRHSPPPRITIQAEFTPVPSCCLPSSLPYKPLRALASNISGNFLG